MKIPHLVQRGTIVSPLAPAFTRLSEAVDFDYMGSSEFEFGALPKSLRRMQKVQASLTRVCEDRILEGEHPLRVVHFFSPADYEKYFEYLKQIRDDDLHLKESAYFQQDRSGYQLKTNFWWDIENDVLWGFHKAFMNRVPNYLASSWAYMDRNY